MLYKNFDRRRKLLFDIGIPFRRGGGGSSDWILGDGTWNDAKIWVDTEIWND